MFKACDTCKGRAIPCGMMEFRIRKCPDCDNGFVDEYEIKKEKFISDLELIEGENE